MSQSRRTWWKSCMGVLAVLALNRLSPGQFNPQPLPSPNAPDPHAPAGLDRPHMAGPDKKTIDPKLQAELRGEVEKLFQLASELKQQVESTDLNSVLSLGVVKRAQEIEKLAKHIKEHAKG